VAAREVLAQQLGDAQVGEREQRSVIAGKVERAEPRDQPVDDARRQFLTP